MSIIYNVTIEPTDTGNRFRITWQSMETNSVNSFDQESEMTLEETQRLWQWPRCQLSIGRKLFRFLDGDLHYFQQALNRANYMGEPLQINLWTCKQTADWPFELLAKDNSFLVSQPLHLVRCVSDWGKEKQLLLGNRPLKLLFMACSALDVQPELDFEKEEEAIFRITENLAIDMEVEDSGSLEGLRSRLEREEYDVVYLSGHAGIDKDGSPYFIMEDEFGNRRQVSPGELWEEALIENPPRLLFLSGCRTGETPETPNSDESTDAVSFAHLLVERYNVPAVLGWGHSVHDNQAIHAGKMLFHELSRGKTILEAVQRARYELITDFPGENKPAWPLLRLFSSGMPLNSIVAKEQEWKPKVRIMTHVYLKNSLVKVLKEGFVGRRRQLQTGLRALKKDYDKVGVLLLGTGGLGKSCLAGKICERFPDHTLIIVHGRLNAISIESALTDTFIAAKDEKGQHILGQKIEMKDKLAHLCATCFKEKKYLFLLDDFEQNLEGVDKGEPGPLLPETADLLKVLLHNLPFSGKMTQLIITSRYAFSLAEQNRDIVEQQLEKVWLTSFQETEQLKKAQQLENIANYKDRSLTPRLLAAGHGNPRLMEWIDHLVGIMIETEILQLLEAVKNKQEDFIRQHVIRELLQHGGKELELFLRWFNIYRRPVMLEGVGQVAEKAGLPGYKELLEVGMRLSLAEHDQVRKNYQVTPLLKEELLKGFANLKECHEAAFAYYKAICEPCDAIDPILTEEWVYHALGCGEEDVASNQGSELVKRLREQLAYQESKRIGEWILREKILELSTGNDANLLNNLGYVNWILGYLRKAIEYYKQSLAIWEKVHGEEHPDIATALNNLGGTYSDLGEKEKAIGYYEQALPIWKKVYGEEHPKFASSLNNLGSGYKGLGELQKAVVYYEQALTIDEKAYGEDHPSVAIRLNNLGLTYSNLGEKEKAIEYYLKAMSIWKKAYGEEHPYIAVSFNNLGGVYSDLGEKEKAIGYYEQAMAIDEKVYSKEHPSVARDLNNLGLTFAELGELSKSISCCERALTIWKKIYGEEHPNIAASLSNLGLAYFELGQKERARTYFETSYAMKLKFHGRDHLSSKKTKSRLDKCL